ncbi:MAG: 3-hydroxyacyl-CoA dehydrogenase NAD-binding domain-containing protein [Gammaproteobacteria bacterium]|nr:3-hydroxyacyl-CoA dehydrogenase NAD-binding domain-containing protein [Gammaproteobacteria bacterium]
MRTNANTVRHIACVGTGTIGAGWAAYFLARGFDVSATDPGANAEAGLRRIVDQAWPQLEKLGLANGASPDRLRFTSNLSEAVHQAEFIQESAPDREDLKIELFAEIDAAAPSDTVIASSSSQFLPTRLAQKCRHPERCVIGHPFTPSYLIPLVEVVGGEHTDPAVIDWAVDFYTAIGKKALKLKKEILSYIANRLQHVVHQEAHRLIDAGVCDFEDVDVAMAYGPGLRWAFAGPLMCSHMGGGKGGIRHMIEHFGWDGPPGLRDEAIDTAERVAGDLSMDEVEQWRDQNLVTMLKSLRPLPRR